MPQPVLNNDAAGSVALIQGSLAPYRISLFNEINAALGGALVVLLARKDPPERRHWSIPWSEVTFPIRVLPSAPAPLQYDLDLCFGISRALDAIRPTTVIVSGWDVQASWGALLWCRRRGVPAWAWVESSLRTGRRRGTLSTLVRRGFLSFCVGAIVPGQRAQAFVETLHPGLRCVRVPNSVDEPLLRSLPPPPRCGGALFLGELSERKGVDIVLSALPALLDLFPWISIAGTGPLHESVAAQARQLSSLHFSGGFVSGSTRIDLISESSVVLVPSRRDPWPLVACEALVAGRPVVLGPGVGSAPDLEALAGGAVATMSADDPGSLVSSASKALASTVPPHVRDSLRPAQSAAAVVAGLLSAPRDGRRP